MKSSIIYYGRTEPEAELLPLQAGPLSLYYNCGDLRYIRFGDREVLRRIYVAIRDRNWDTIVPVISNTQTNVEDDSFFISFDVENKQGDIDYAWRGEISGNREGTITFSMEGKARSTFYRNRIGFCVLHPGGECSGRACSVKTVDDAVIDGVFPHFISPHQPFKGIKSIRHRVGEGIEAEVRFNGDVFEMEDQRNWTDASFKTYCTPLELPFPVRIEAGTAISQSVTLTLKLTKEQSSRRVVPVERKRISVHIGDIPLGKLPRIGLESASHGRNLNRQEIGRLRGLNLSHLRVEIKLYQTDWQETLARAVKDVQSLDLELELAVFVSDRAEIELQSLAGILDPSIPVSTCLIFHKDEKSTGCRWIELARKQLTGVCERAMLGAGSDAYFAELNRQRPPVELLDLICYSLNPQVHAFDNLSLAESLEGQAATVQSARQIADGLPIAITPITLRSRRNPNATGEETDIGPDGLPSAVDPRQMSLFAAAWTAGSIKQIGQRGVYSVTYFETTGWRGVMELAGGPPSSEIFHSISGSVFPVYHLLVDVGEYRDAFMLPVESSDPLEIQGLALQQGGKKRIILANLGGRRQSVTIAGLSEPCTVRSLDERTFQRSCVSPEEYRSDPREKMKASGSEVSLELLPYALKCIDMNRP